MKLPVNYNIRVEIQKKLRVQIKKMISLFKV